MPRAKRTGRPKRAGHDKEATKGALIAAGMELFAKQGLDGPSLDDICAHAGFTRGAFYVHFQDRDDFLAAVMDHVGSRIVDELLVDGGGADGLVGAMERFVAASASGKYPLMPAGGIRMHQLLDACARSRPVRDRYLGLVDMSMARIAELVGQGRKDGIVRDDLEPARTATMVMALVVGVQTLADLGVPIALGPLAADVLRLMSKPNDAS
jgi:TetR/AcrR family transcriptional regulator, transcriptional repressor for nem operon